MVHACNPRSVEAVAAAMNKKTKREQGSLPLYQLGEQIKSNPTPVTPFNQYTTIQAKL